MRYRDSIVEAILIERDLGKTYREISDKLDISVYKVKKVIKDHCGQRTRRGKTKKAKTSNLDSK